MKMRKTVARIAAIMLCLALILNITGCKKSKPNTPDSNPSVTEKAGNNTGTTEDTDSTESNASTSTPLPKIDDNGKPIYDFDEFVNGEWRREQEANNKSGYASYEEAALVRERLADILENTDISGMSEEDGLYKAIVIYRALMNTENLQEKIESIGSFLAPIDQIKSYEDLYDIYANEYYAPFNAAFRFEVKSDSNGYNVSYLRPVSIAESIRRAMAVADSTESEEELAQNRERLFSYLSELGYSRERVDEMIANAKIISDIIEEYPQVQLDGSYTNYYFSEEDLTEAGVSVPVFEIMRRLNGLGQSERIFAADNCCELLKKLYAPENIAAHRDYILLYSLVIFFSVSGYATESDEPAHDHGQYVLSIMMDLAADVLAEEYMNRYLPEDTLETLRVLTGDIKEAAKSVIYDADWLSASSKEAARAKLMKMRVCAGKNGYVNDLSDVTISDNAIENFIRLYASNGRFYRSQTDIQGDYRKIFGCYMFDVNGKYFADYNSYALTVGLLCNEMCTEAATYEEKLGYLGFVIAHEIAHSYDPMLIDHDEYGYYEQWLKEDEMTRYGQNVQKIIGTLDGLDAGYGKKISGQRTVAETYSDLMAMQICLKMLAEKENADYNLFFVTLAKQRAAYYTEKDMDTALMDEHLPGNIRNNYTFAQFDEFYEIYDIDENSPYYVPEEERLKAF